MNRQTISINTPLNFNFQECLWFLDRNFDDCMHKVTANQVTRVIEIDSKPVLIVITATDNVLHIEIPEGGLSPNEIKKLEHYVADWFDLDKDLEPFYELLNAEDALAYMTTEYKGLRLMGIPNLFEAICWAIIGQQINLTFAYKLKRRLVEKYGNGLEYQNSVYYIFPDCKVLARADIDDLKQMQFSGSKAAYLLNIAGAFASGEISREKLIALPDSSSRQKMLINIKGIGTWTANYALMKSLKDRSCIPFGDAGLLNSMLNHQLITDKKQQREIELFFKSYPEWESYLVFYLWRSLSKR